eukprot:scaffold5958_cov175-Prasinococcus_capsulatus_cf.AAC.1
MGSGSSRSGAARGGGDEDYAALRADILRAVVSAKGNACPIVRAPPVEGPRLAHCLPARSPMLGAERLAGRRRRHRRWCATPGTRPAPSTAATAPAAATAPRCASRRRPRTTPTRGCPSLTTCSRVRPSAQRHRHVSESAAD